MSLCTLCPRKCGADRAVTRGACHAGETLTLARAALHGGEEPCLAPGGRSGAVFFSGCALGCVFCQNDVISSKTPVGFEVEEEKLCEILLRLQEEGAENIDLVTASHFAPAVARVLERVKENLSVPVIFNCSGYESVEQLRLLDGLVDVYLPDFKFFSPFVSARLCRAADYAEVCQKALLEMYRQCGACVFDDAGKLMRGVLVRHLVLPTYSQDSLDVLSALSFLFEDVCSVRLSLMRQYTPMPACGAYPELSRPVTTLEYERVVRRAAELGFSGYVQEKSSVGTAKIPIFDGTGVIERV